MQILSEVTFVFHFLPIASNSSIRFGSSYHVQNSIAKVNIFKSNNNLVTAHRRNFIDWCSSGRMLTMRPNTLCLFFAISRFKPYESIVLLYDCHRAFNFASAFPAFCFIAVTKECCLFSFRLSDKKKISCGWFVRLRSLITPTYSWFSLLPTTFLK